MRELLFCVQNVVHRAYALPNLHHRDRYVVETNDSRSRLTSPRARVVTSSAYNALCSLCRYRWWSPRPNLFGVLSDPGMYYVGPACAVTTAAHCIRPAPIWCQPARRSKFCSLNGHSYGATLVAGLCTWFINEPDLLKDFVWLC